MLKSIRNAVADSAAAVAAYHIPTLEPLFRAAGRAIEPIPKVRSVYRRGVETLLPRLVPQPERYRVSFVLEIDVEGAELMVLHGAERTLRERPPRRWIVETEPGSEACRLLAAHGYHEEHLDPAGDKVNAVFTHPSAK
ncbi:MAG: hypothetical protein SH850_26895 [Planctomycetaceae bacterium]|nr:hypothetical protein [Planctomycetaceae bacterium]